MTQLVSIPDPPLGVCACGCGHPTKVATRPDKARGYVVGTPRRYLNHHCPRARGPRPTSRHANELGYVLVACSGHSRADRAGYVREHLLIAERVLGRPLPRDVEVHHVDMDPGNNANRNLVICQDHGYHGLLHQRQHALDACGDANAMLCQFCQNYDRPGNMIVRSRARRRNGRFAFHAECQRKDARSRYHAAKREQVTA